MKPVLVTVPLWYSQPDRSTVRPYHNLAQLANELPLVNVKRLAYITFQHDVLVQLDVEIKQGYYYTATIDEWERVAKANKDPEIVTAIVLAVESLTGFRVEGHRIKANASGLFTLRCF